MLRRNHACRPQACSAVAAARSPAMPLHFSHVSSALIASLVGFAGTLALIVAAAQAVGATAAQTVSWITAISLVKALEAGYLTWRHRMPILTAWSTPGAALIGASAGITLDAAAGAFLLAGALIVATALLRPLGRLIERIPMSIAAAMLAGVLLPFVLGAFKAIPQAPALAVTMIAVYVLVRPFSPLFAVVIVLAAGIAACWALGLIGPLAQAFSAPGLEFVLPRFEPSVLIGLGVPLYLVTMASQNLPGFAVLRASGYAPPVRQALAVTGTGSMASAFFGAHTTNLAAITAALCSGPDVDRDPARRWPAGMVYALAWLALSLAGASGVALLAALPPALIAVVVGLALLGPLVGALGTAMKDEAERYPALLAFAVSAAGVSFGGIGAAFWGLAAGLLAHALEHGLRALRRRGVRG
jgi:benzoate membrane transport protein